MMMTLRFFDTASVDGFKKRDVGGRGRGGGAGVGGGLGAGGEGGPGGGAAPPNSQTKVVNLVMP